MDQYCPIAVSLRHASTTGPAWLAAAAVVVLGAVAVAVVVRFPAALVRLAANTVVRFPSAAAAVVVDRLASAVVVTAAAVDPTPDDDR